MINKSCAEYQFLVRFRHSNRKIDAVTEHVILLYSSVTIVLYRILAGNDAFAITIQIALHQNGQTCPNPPLSLLV